MARGVLLSDGRGKEIPMTKLLLTITVIGMLGGARGRAAHAAAPTSPPPAVSNTPSPVPPPQEPPPPPGPQIPTPPHTQPIEPSPADWNARAAPVKSVPPGQWVYTAQYGWLWMPYGAEYTQVVPDAALAYMFAYYPAFGWRWVVAPWVLGLGIAPHWGILGPTHFAWYAHPRFRVPTPYRGRGWNRPTVGRSLRGLHRGHR
jgi:hypothetical protein